MALTLKERTLPGKIMACGPHRHTVAQQRVGDLRVVPYAHIVQEVAPRDVGPPPDAAVAPNH